MYKLADIIISYEQRNLFNLYCKKLGIELPMRYGKTKKGTNCNMLYISKMLVKRIRTNYNTIPKGLYSNNEVFEFVLECVESKIEKM